MEIKKRHFVRSIIILILTIACFAPLWTVPFLPSENFLPVLMIVTLPIWIVILISIAIYDHVKKKRAFAAGIVQQADQQGKKLSAMNVITIAVILISLVAGFGLFN